jgi:DNA polymerase IV
MLTWNGCKANIALVNQDYPSECLRFRSLLKVTQSRFRIEGTPLGDMGIFSPALSGPMSDAFPPLKPPQRRGQHSPTPSPIANPEQYQIAESTSKTSKHERENARLNLTGPTNFSDPLDEVMTMVKATAGLVSEMYPLNTIHTDELTASGRERQRPVFRF